MVQGVIAQLGERLNGIQEVGGSIPPGSTKQIKGLAPKTLLQSVQEKVIKSYRGSLGSLRVSASLM
jgi:hypothetical protein